jgi:hypothetical protein
VLNNFALVWFIFLLLGGGLVFWSGSGLLSSFKFLREGAPIAARIISKNIISGGSGAQGGSSTYYPDVSYEYAVCGRTYSSSRVDAAEVPYGSRETASEHIQQFEVGKPATAFYLPGQPDQSCLVKNHPHSLLNVFIIGAIICLGAIFGLICHAVNSSAVKSRLKWLMRPH